MFLVGGAEGQEIGPPSDERRKGLRKFCFRLPKNELELEARGVVDLLLGLVAGRAYSFALGEGRRWALS